MTKDELITQLAATRGKTKVDKLVKIIEEHSFRLRDIIDLTFHDDKTIAFRAAWLLENILLLNPVFYINDFNYLLDKFIMMDYPSSQRHYVKIIMHLTSPKAHSLVKQKIAAMNLDQVVEKCFDWMIDPAVLIAVKRFAAEALFNIHQRYDWIADELVAQMHYLMRDGSAAIQTYGKKVLMILENERNVK